MTMIDPVTGRRTQGLGGRWSPPVVQAGSRKHQIAILWLAEESHNLRI